MGKGERIEAEGNGERRIVYCVLPPDLAPSLHEVLRRHFRDDPAVEVVVERRRSDRRSGGERRTAGKAAPPTSDRRRIRGRGGRRGGERRAMLLEIGDPPELPRRARRHLDRIGFVVRAEPSSLRAEDLDTARLVARFQAGERDAFAAIYERYFDRVYGYLRGILNDAHEAEDATQQVFMKLIDGIHSYERRGQPFRAWLFRVVRNHALTHLRRQGRIVPTDPEDVERERDLNHSGAEPLGVLEWIGDRDLLLFVERLPLAQRQVLLLRYMLDMTDAQAAEVLGRSRDDVRALQSRAVRFLRARLVALGRRSDSYHRGHRPRMKRVRRQAVVLRERRYSLLR